MNEKQIRKELKSLAKMTERTGLEIQDLLRSVAKDYSGDNPAVGSVDEALLLYLNFALMLHDEIIQVLFMDPGRGVIDIYDAEELSDVIRSFMKRMTGEMKYHTGELRNIGK